MNKLRKFIEEAGWPRILIAAFLVLRRTNAVIDEIEVHRANKAPFA